MTGGAGPRKVDESGLPADRLWQPITARWFLVVFGGCAAYAIVRYHLVGEVGWDHSFSLRTSRSSSRPTGA